MAWEILRRERERTLLPATQAPSGTRRADRGSRTSRPGRPAACPARGSACGGRPYPPPRTPPPGAVFARPRPPLRLPTHPPSSSRLPAFGPRSPLPTHPFSSQGPPAPGIPPGDPPVSAGHPGRGPPAPRTGAAGPCEGACVRGEPARAAATAPRLPRNGGRAGSVPSIRWIGEGPGLPPLSVIEAQAPQRRDLRPPESPALTARAAARARPHGEGGGPRRRPAAAPALTPLAARVAPRSSAPRRHVRAGAAQTASVEGKGGRGRPRGRCGAVRGRRGDRGSNTPAQRGYGGVAGRGTALPGGVEAAGTARTEPKPLGEGAPASSSSSEALRPLPPPGLRWGRPGRLAQPLPESTEGGRTVSALLPQV
ncbi:uncharacterized protein LOC142057015 [Phalacrocorax aristotelis]|uniref:uncharacterized protein LOC142057015 n=1 Tax=Phalacrocorax aristotelis TaxID=126867 RepID=UPI003F4B97B6